MTVFYCSLFLDEAQQYVKIFSDIERYPQIRNYYIGCHKVRHSEFWFLVLPTPYLLQISFHSLNSTIKTQISFHGLNSTTKMILMLMEGRYNIASMCGMPSTMNECSVSRKRCQTHETASLNLAMMFCIETFQPTSLIAFHY